MLSIFRQQPGGDGGETDRDFEELFIDLDGRSAALATIANGFFELRTQMRGSNLNGMEMAYTSWTLGTGPIAGTHYPNFVEASLLPYLDGKNVQVIRLLFSWDAMQPALLDTIPGSGNFLTYYNNFKATVDYATGLGIRVVISAFQTNPAGGTGGACHRGAVVGAGVVTNADFADFWGQMAALFADNPLVDINLCNEPNNTDTMLWFSAAQAAITAIRATAFTGYIQVPGNGWSAASTWTSSWYDTNATQRSNAYGWLNAGGVGVPLSDPLDKLIVEVHSYADTDASGADNVVSTTISRERVKVTVDWARTNNLTVFLGEIGMKASTLNATPNFTDFVSYADDNDDVLIGFAWWACGNPGWWDDTGAYRFSITPTSSYTVDTLNMNLLEGFLFDFPIGTIDITGGTEAVSEWLPSSVGTVRLDIDSRYVQTTGSDVDVALDRSGNGYDAAFVTTKPTLEASNPDYGGLPALRFAGDAMLLTPAGSADVGTSAVTIILIGHIDDDEVTAAYSVNRSGELALGTVDNAPQMWRYVTEATNYSTTRKAMQPAIVIATFEGATSRFYKNSKTPETVVAAAHTVTAGNGWAIGNYSDAPGTLFVHDGPMCRVIIYDGALTQMQVEAAFDGLCEIYSRTLTPLADDLYSWWRGDADATLASGGTELAALGDLVGGDSNRDLATSGSGTNPSYILSDPNFGGRPSWGTSLVANEAGKWMVTGTFAVPLAGAKTVYRVYYVPTANGATVYPSLDNIGNEGGIPLYGAPTAIGLGIDVDAQPPLDVMSISCAVYDGASSAAYVDDFTTAVDTGTTGSVDFSTLGTGSFPGEPSRLRMAEIIVCEGSHDATKRAAYQAYLEDLYGIGGSSNFPRTINESLSAPTDAVTRQGVFFRSMGENVSAPTDANTRAATFLRAIIESILAPTDANLRVIASFRAQTETVSAPTDANARVQVLARGQVETLSAPTDVNARFIEASRTMVESIDAPVDAVSRTVSISRGQSESILAPTDTNSRSTVVSRTQVEVVAAPTDVNSRAIVVSRTQVEVVAAPTDVNTRAFGVTRVMTESVSAPTDANTRTVEVLRSMAEIVSAPTDANTRAIVVSRGQDETVSAPTDANVRAASYARVQLEAVLIPTDANARMLTLTRSQDENVSAPADANTRVVGFFRSLSETILAPSDAITRQGAFARGQDESIDAPTDTNSNVVSGSNNFDRFIAENIGAPIDSNTRVVTMMRVHGEDVLAPIDAITRATSVIRSQPEILLAPTDLITRSVSVQRTNVESISAPSDTNARLTIVARSVVESIDAPTDVNTRGYGVSKFISESIPAPTDANTHAAIFARFVEELLLPPTDVVVRAAYYSREIFETVPIPTDAVSYLFGTADIPASITLRDAPFAQLIGVVQPFAQVVLTSRSFVTIAFTHDTLASVDFVTIAPFAEIAIIMNQDKYDIGDTVEVVVEIRVTRTKVLTNPTTLTARLTSPAGVVTTYTYPCAEIVNDATGKFRGLFNCTAAGPWEVKWTGTGAAKFARKMFFMVE